MLNKEALPDFFKNAISTIDNNIDLCESGIDESLNLTDMSSGIIKGVVVGVITAFIILKVLK